MKKLFTLIFLSIVSVTSHAVPMTWTESIAFEDVYFSGGKDDGIKKYTYTHDITNDGFHPDQDSVLSYSLSFKLFDDNSGDGKEIAVIKQAGYKRGDRVKISFDDIELGNSSLGFYSINDDGLLELTIKRKKGDFILASSTITATGIPEPAPFILFSVALVGFSIAQRKRKLG